MTIAYNFVTHEASAGRKEDVLDIITQISPDETPFLSRLGISRAYSVTHEWMTDSLASGVGTASAVIEGASADQRALSDRTRNKNYTQITAYTFGISGTQEAVSHFGLDSEYSYQLERAMKILKIMMEQVLFTATTDATMVGSGAMATVCATGARTMNGLLAVLSTTVCTGSAGVCALTESMYNALLQAIYAQGGNPDITYTNGYNKRRISSFATSNTRTLDMGAEGRLRNFVSIYESDFGVQEIVLDRYVGVGDVHVLQADMWKIAYLRNPSVIQLAVDGDRKRAELLTEYTLEHLNEKSSGRFSAVASA